ncbi:hypothetical protein KSC_039860 [Ktedonobacter sp. SOSP1-52]|nr:hypothetical protein KSC_039860 [Ktedonobacter sp. SOSP1-52]
MQNMRLFSAAMILMPSLPAPFSQLKFFCNITERETRDLNLDVQEDDSLLQENVV